MFVSLKQFFDTLFLHTLLKIWKLRNVNTRKKYAFFHREISEFGAETSHVLSGLLK